MAKLNPKRRAAKRLTTAIMAAAKIRAQRSDGSEGIVRSSMSSFPVMRLHAEAQAVVVRHVVNLASIQRRDGERLVFANDQKRLRHVRLMRIWAECDRTCKLEPQKTRLPDIETRKGTIKRSESPAEAAFRKLMAEPKKAPTFEGE